MQTFSIARSRASAFARIKIRYWHWSKHPKIVSSFVNVDLYLFFNSTNNITRTSASGFASLTRFLGGQIIYICNVWVPDCGNWLPLPLPPCLPCLSPFIFRSLAAADALFPKLVSLHDFAFGCRCCLVCEACFPSLFRFWLPLPPCRCRLVSQACLPS